MFCLSGPLLSDRFFVGRMSDCRFVGRTDRQSDMRCYRHYEYFCRLVGRMSLEQLWPSCGPLMKSTSIDKVFLHLVTLDEREPGHINALGAGKDAWGAVGAPWSWKRAVGFSICRMSPLSQA